MINLTKEEILLIGKQKLATNVCDLAKNELFGLPQCKTNCWGKEFLRNQVIDTYESSSGKKAKVQITFPINTGVCTGLTFPVSVFQVAISKLSPFISYVSFIQGSFPGSLGVYTMQDIVDKINDPVFGNGFTAEWIAINTLEITAPVAGTSYNGVQFFILWYSSLPLPVCPGNSVKLFSGGEDAACTFDQQTVDCYYSVLNS